VERFELNRLTVTFLLLIAVVAVVVAVAAPFGSIALAALSLLAVGVVLIKAMFRTRRWWPLTAVEGTIAASGLVLLVGGLGVVGVSLVRFGMGEQLGMMVGWPYVDRSRGEVGSRAVHYSDPDTRQRLKDELGAAGIPFTTKQEEGKEFIRWSSQHNAAAEAINEKVRAGPFGSGRNVHIPDAALHGEFVGWLTGKRIEHKVVRNDGKDWVVWDDSAGDLMRQFMESRGSADCKGKVAAGKAESSRC
jgi:hypothetical protein